MILMATKGGEEVHGGRGSDGEKSQGREEAAQGRQHCPGDNNKKSTITSREIQITIRLVLPGELAKIAVSKETKVVTN